MERATSAAQAPRLSAVLRAEAGDEYATVDFAAAAERLHARLLAESSAAGRAQVASGWPAAVLGDWKTSEWRGGQLGSWGGGLH